MSGLGLDVPEPAPPPGLPALFRAFFRASLFGFGGGVAVLALLRDDVVERRRWLGPAEFAGEVALATSVPGAFAVSAALMVGRRLRGWPGAAAALLGAVLPPFLVILALAAFAGEWLAAPGFRRFLTGAGAAVVGLIAASAAGLGRSMVTSWRDAAVCLAVVLAVAVAGLHPLLALGGALAVGLLAGPGAEAAP